MKPTQILTIASMAAFAFTVSCGTSPDVEQTSAPTLGAPANTSKTPATKAKAPSKTVTKPDVTPDVTPATKPTWPEPAPIETKDIPAGESSLRHKTPDQPVTP